MYSCYGFRQGFINDCDVLNFTLIGFNSIISVSLLARYKAILLCTDATDFFYKGIILQNDHFMVIFL